MVDDRRSRYIGGSEGAPPLPPAGGYQGARRSGTAQGAAAVAAAPPVSVTHTEEASKQPRNMRGFAALIAASLFAVTLLILVIGGMTDLIYSVSLLVVQLLVIAVVIAALASRRGRMLGAIALVVTLLFNVATVGAIGSVQAAARQDYDGTKSEAQRHQEAYPGIKDVPNDAVLAQPSLEEVQAEGDELLADIRARVTEEFGYTWVEAGDVDISPERNGYGGESMLSSYTSPTWTTAEPVQDNDRKREVLAVVERMLYASGLNGFYVLNSVDSGISNDMVAKLYGSTTSKSSTPGRGSVTTIPIRCACTPTCTTCRTMPLASSASGERRSRHRPANPSRACSWWSRRANCSARATVPSSSSGSRTTRRSADPTPSGPRGTRR